MGIDWEALRGGTSALVPPAGIHTARLETAKIVQTNSGDEKMVTSWQTTGDPIYVWETWHGLSGRALGFTLELLDGLKVDRSKLTDYEAFDTGLAACIGRTYQVETKLWGSANDQVNVTILATGPVGSDIPAEPVTVPDVGDDDDIPF